MDSTKIIPINQHTILQEINEQNYNNFLTNVVPINIHELSSFYSEEKSQFLRNEMDLVDVSNEEVESVLEYLKLPKSLIEIKEMFNFAQQGTEIPSQIKDKVAEIASSYNQDAQTKSSIESLRRQILETISACDSKLSGSFSNKDELIQLKKVLYDATNSDQKLFSLIDPSLYSILSKGPDSTEFTGLFEGQDEIKQAAPEVSLLDIDDSKQDSDVVSSNIKRLEDILHDIHMAKSQKMKLMEKLKTEIHNDDISDILILNSKLKSSNEIRTVIFPEELKKFNPYNEELDKLVTKEKSFINDLKSNWNNLVTNPQVKNMTKNRVSLDKKVSESTGRIIEFYENWKKYHAGLAKGRNFYQDLLNHASKVKNDIEMGIKMNEGFKNLNVGAPTGGQQQYQQFTGGSQEGYRQQVASPQSSGHNYQQYASPQSTGQNYQQYASPQSTGPSYQQQPPTAQQFPPQPMVNRHDSYSAQYPSQQQSQSSQYQPAQAQTQPPQYQSQYQPQPQYQGPPPLVNRGSTDASGFGYQHRQNQIPPQQPPVLNRPSTFESNPSMTYTPPIQSGQYGQAPLPPQGYSRPPQLPPKQPSYSQPSAPKPPVPPQVPSQAQPPPPQQQPSGQVPWNQNEANKSNNSLIYDQPSTYNPNMYNFFSSN
ncbi:uncharacterized protein SPAPADRAFT_61835 [Spathaspora passalidarum NRRL Y-27907]|uniref:ALIX V-shaped domain-containing protein n=1 Tax=Spathaspora passalidarum (strain NRRL Y-27907 / 11-Y1) TaxID=619300 RepID=G3AR88_SPAPN|nr:uncharacterized protein SPAPADRAFT_61835 [Spathaspora passalidarum NRRL Y-27907]EGW31263.1 hypothetical protein SPAPADRAFT_61835 [Spathaspora passalidarum NRRL Y-27907]